MRVVRTDSTNPDFLALVKLLDQDLAKRDGEDHAFFAQFNKVDLIRHVVLLYAGERPVSCGAVKHLEEGIIEVKRMYTLPDFRGKRYASKVLSELEIWAAELGYEFCQLETGLKQPEAIRLYERSGYARIPNYGQYENVESSVCFKKKVK